ncbi:hypothetical protein T265_10478 [Opisthorchis viverrini]|uniref:Uncharacterized protein n=1 Tax=Opisthorchis viverrini TaxID=6198 RepID=A0A074Z297_OPIVI|nr:hypothetical protein T265_10478 [Opisthorchis viverrini]KER21118.1 hypothetical protein T265_10478 [Opisthorchis viverrini]
MFTTGTPPLAVRIEQIFTQNGNQWTERCCRNHKTDCTFIIVVKLANRSVRRNSTCIPPYHWHSGAATAEKSIPRKIGQEFGTLAGPAPRRNPIGRKFGPKSQS